MEFFKGIRARCFVGVLGVLVAGLCVPTLEASNEIRLVLSDGDCILLAEGVELGIYREAILEPPQGVEGTYAASGFIRSLRTPSGKELLDVFPVGHRHHRGIFAAWTRVEVQGTVVDYWNVHKGTGRTEAVGQCEVLPNGFTAERRYFNDEFGETIREKWTVITIPSADFNILDIVIQQIVVESSGLNLLKYRYGGFAFRGTALWNSRDTEQFLGPMEVRTSAGIIDRKRANHQPARWVMATGPLEGGSGGLVIMEHPGTTRHPQTVRVHPEMPYFVFCPVVEADLRLQMGDTVMMRYRILTFDKVPTESAIEAAYTAFVESVDATTWE